MGGNSSKKKITPSSQDRGSNVTINTVHTVDGESVMSECKGHKKDKKKAKVKDNNRKKKDKKNGKFQPGCKAHVKISFDDKPIVGFGDEEGGGGGCSQRNRKKSACPSCDAREILMGQIRSRSGSLRYSDFNKIVRQSRVEEDEEESPLEIALDGVHEPLADTVCFICGVYTGSVTRTCRVCCHVYHNGCLHKIGHAMDTHALELAQLDMWSCHQCSDVSRLLSREETQHAFNCLEDLSVDPDSLTVQNYIEYKEKIYGKLGKPVTQDKKIAWIGRFNFVTDTGSAELDWSQFLQAETISILRNRTKDSLVKLMTEMEFAAARKMYKDMKGKTGQDAKMAQIKDRILQLYCKFGRKLWPEDEDEVASLEEEDLERSVSWSEFLRLLAIHMLTVRENSSSALMSANDSDDMNWQQRDNNNSDVMTPSPDSIDDEDEYRTCDSELDTSNNTNSATTLPRNKNRKTSTSHKRNLSDFELLNGSDDANKSISILDDLSRAFNLTGNNNSVSRQFQEAPLNDSDVATNLTKSAYTPDSSSNLTGNNNNESSNSNEIQDTTANDSNSAKDPDDSSKTEDARDVKEKVVESSRKTSNTNASLKRHLWANPPSLRDNSNFTTSSVDTLLTTVEVSRAKAGSISLEKSPVVSKRRSEVLIRPSTEEGRSPRRAFSQKVVVPAYGLVDKVQSQDWNC